MKEEGEKGDEKVPIFMVVVAGNSNYWFMVVVAGNSNNWFPVRTSLLMYIFFWDGNWVFFLNF